MKITKGPALPTGRRYWSPAGWNVYVQKIGKQWYAGALGMDLHTGHPSKTAAVVAGVNLFWSMAARNRQQTRK